MSEQFCDNGKIIFATEHDANVQIKNFPKDRHKKKAYKCNLGNHWHITTITKIRHKTGKLEKYPIKFKSSNNIPKRKKKK